MQNYGMYISQTTQIKKVAIRSLQNCITQKNDLTSHIILYIASEYKKTHQELFQ